MDPLFPEVPDDFSMTTVYDKRLSDHYWDMIEDDER